MQFACLESLGFGSCIRRSSWRWKCCSSLHCLTPNKLFEPKRDYDAITADDAHADDEDDDDAGDAHADDDDDHLRVHITHSRACHMLPWERVSHITQKECEGAKGEATTVSVGSSHPEQEGLGLETSTSEVRTRTGSATLCCVGLVEDVARRG